MESQKKWSITPLIRIFAVILVLGGIALGAMAFTTPNTVNDDVIVVDDDDEDPNPPMHFFGRGGFWGMPGGHHGGRWGDLDYDSFLADALGITVQELQDAYDEATAAMIDEAVAQGYLTQEEADLIKARNALMAYIDRDEIIAEALGISVEDLEAARESDKSISDLIDELGLERDAVREAIQAAYEKAVTEAVGEGIITQEQADQILEGEVGFPMMGGHHGFGGRGGFLGKERPCPVFPESDTSTDTSL